MKIQEQKKLWNYKKLKLKTKEEEEGKVHNHILSKKYDLNLLGCGGTGAKKLKLVRNSWGKYSFRDKTLFVMPFYEQNFFGNFVTLFSMFLASLIELRAVEAVNLQKTCFSP